VLTAAFDRSGRSVQSLQQSVGLTWRSAGAASTYELVSRLALKPGRYEIRAAVDADAKDRGSVYTFVDVPDFAQRPLSLSGIVLTVSPPAPSAGADGLTGWLPVVPSVRRDFARTDRATAFARVYQSRKDPVQPATVAARIERADGKVEADDVVSLPADRFAANRGADHRVALPVDRLEPGEYLLTIEARKGQYTARRGLRFTVR
jgi:hypothetical protein